MRNINYLILINFKIKTSSSKTFLNEPDVGYSNVVNMVSRGILERHVGCCNHGGTWDV